MGKTIVISSQHSQRVAALCNRVAIIEKGRTHLQRPGAGRARPDVVRAHLLGDGARRQQRGDRGVEKPAGSADAVPTDGQVKVTFKITTSIPACCGDPGPGRVKFTVVGG